MSKVFIFVSCGQHSESEKSLGRSIVKMVKTTAAWMPSLQRRSRTLNGLDSNILGALHDCAALITVMHPRGNIVRPDNYCGNGTAEAFLSRIASRAGNCPSSGRSVSTRGPN
jgi:hypothetical protein